MRMSTQNIINDVHKSKYLTLLLDLRNPSRQRVIGEVFIHLVVLKFVLPR